MSRGFGMFKCEYLFFRQRFTFHIENAVTKQTQDANHLLLITHLDSRSDPLPDSKMDPVKVKCLHQRPSSTSNDWTQMPLEEKIVLNGILNASVTKLLRFCRAHLMRHFLIKIDVAISTNIGDVLFRWNHVKIGHS
ncbi:MAG: hypothetical protein IPN87_13760 [Saprospiraceae bacterium]|nr:hypothetical protein [Candidatus Brachybacter algidus]